MEKQIYTLGTSNWRWEEFLEILMAYNIERLVDVRRFPRSRWEWFNRERMGLLLKKEGIAYFYLGEELGGYRKGGYQVFTKSDKFKEGVSKLIEIAKEVRTVVVCAERFPWRCHRRYISRAIRDRGWRVLHILEKDRIWTEKE